MLVDVKLQDSPMRAMLDIISGGSSRVTRLERGIYECSHFSFENEFRDQDYEKDYPTFGHENDFESFSNFLKDGGVFFSSYGVCDSLDNLKEHLPVEVLEGETEYVISLTPVYKDNQPAQGGWRWHKWGAYIGEYEPKYEYLYNEDIDMVYCYKVMKV